MESISPLIHIDRYGTARQMSFELIEALIHRLVTQSSLALPHECRNINEDEAQRYHQVIETSHQALMLATLPQEVLEYLVAGVSTNC